MATINIRRDVTDQFYRYKMERIQSKIEGKGNGIKTVIVNLTSVANSLARPPAHVIKYFGFELGAQTNTNPNDDRWIINGAHDASKLQDYLDGFISKFVLCKKCKNPETDVHIKDGNITLDCKACGKISDVDARLKLSSFILKDAPKKGKKDKSTKKAERRARKEAEARGEEPSQNGSPGDSAEDDENGDFDVEAGSDDELTRQINEGADEIEEAKEVEWHLDTSEEAIRARAKDLPDDLKRALVIEDDEEGEGGSNYDVFGKWIIDTAAEKGSVDKLDNVEIYLKAKELGIESKHRTLTVIPQTLFTEKIVKQIEGRAPMLKKLLTSERHEKAFLGGTERFVGNDKPELIPQISAILLKYYENDLVSEEVLKGWCSKASKKYVDLKTSKSVRKAAEKFAEWLENAESDEEDSE
ncbi:eukaryotic translation initiation factor-like protein 5 [Dothidotthia symphoricarpi CBS 119687]|uniref:Eukaryotic translation initiation factor-like protein 5 n=1 Tax=Dothidotthia symphoricarpi CBS 119687 TaxID=1392245 RepID=A0A6A6A3K3_9PLEO|nr:eukaryotic translation initiation factor-like protein 5 [Dothidotthia symphoricarpi CBS 119687]KAF2126136.1 eukaryotic translation initiation factor-like protein 5 [Dothidotthia symphoricarpi CBS 119687]